MGKLWVVWSMMIIFESLKKKKYSQPPMQCDTGEFPGVHNQLPLFDPCTTSTSSAWFQPDWSRAWLASVIPTLHKHFTVQNTHRNVLSGARVRLNNLCHQRPSKADQRQDPLIPYRVWWATGTWRECQHPLPAWKMAKLAICSCVEWKTRQTTLSYKLDNKQTVRGWGHEKNQWWILPRRCLFSFWRSGGPDFGLPR